MGVDTQLVINSKYSVDMDLVSAIKGHLPVLNPDKIRYRSSEHSATYGTILFTLDPERCEVTSGECRDMSVHLNYRTPIGNATLLTLGAKQDPWRTEAQYIMKTLGDVFGGYYTPLDHSDNMEEIHGILEPSNGLPFHIQWGILNGHIKEENSAGRRGLDLTGLRESIDKWDDYITTSRGKTRIF